MVLFGMRKVLRKESDVWKLKPKSRKLY